MKADLHLHSKFSDGKQWPEEIVAQAKAIGSDSHSVGCDKDLFGQFYGDFEGFVK